MRKKFLEQGFRDAGVALQVFEHRYSQQINEKIAISIAHVMYTRALILCHEANTDGYSNISTNSEAIRVLYIALKSPYNTYAFAKGDSYNFRNVIKRTILKAMTQKDLFTSDVYGFVEELFSIISENEKREWSLSNTVQEKYICVFMFWEVAAWLEKDRRLPESFCVIFIHKRVYFAC